MHEIMELKEMLCKELEEYGSKGDLSAGSLEIIDKLAHAVKNLGKIIEMSEEEEYSNAGGGGRYSREGGSGNRYSRNDGGYSRTVGYSRNDGGSYARGRRRDSMGRYSREGGYSRADGMDELMENLQSVMGELPPEVKMDAQRLVKKLEEQMM